MNQPSARKAPPPPAFIRKAPAIPATSAAPAIPVAPVARVDASNIDEGIYIPKIRREPIKNSDVRVSSFPRDVENDLFNTFGEEIMSVFITDEDRIGAAYVVMQSVINSYTEKFKKPDVMHALSPQDLDGGITVTVIRGILADMSNYYNYFMENSKTFKKKKDNFALPEPQEIIPNSPVSVITFMLALFKTISTLDEVNVSADETQLHTPYESDMINIDKHHHAKIWDLAEQIKKSIAERDAIIDEIAVPVMKRGYPVDARKLAANFLRESKRNPDIALDALYHNPATFAPIQTDKLPRKFFGLLKAKPHDAIEINKSLGRFLKKFVS